MNTIIAFVKRLRLAQITLVFFAGLVLLIGTACSQSPVDRASNSRIDNNTPYRIQENTATDLKETYFDHQPKQGGMNQHQDVDPRRDLTSPATKADRLIKQSEQNIQQRRAANPKQAVENLQETVSRSKVGDKIESATDRVGQSLEEMKEGAQRGARNLKENIKSAGNDVSQNVKETARDM